MGAMAQYLVESYTPKRGREDLRSVVTRARKAAAAMPLAFAAAPEPGSRKPAVAVRRELTIRVRGMLL